VDDLTILNRKSEIWLLSLAGSLPRDSFPIVRLEPPPAQFLARQALLSALHVLFSLLSIHSTATAICDLGLSQSL